MDRRRGLPGELLRLTRLTRGQKGLGPLKSLLSAYVIGRGGRSDLTKERLSLQDFQRSHDLLCGSKADSDERPRSSGRWNVDWA